MNTKRFLITASLALFVLILALLSSQAAISGQALPAAALASPVGTAFTYQGQLKSEETPYDGTCDFQFGLWDALADGAQFGITLTKLNVSVNEGFFAVQLDWGANAFQGDARWLEISVRCPAGGGDYTLLTPRQPLTPTPYALYVAGTWRTTGNAGTTPGTHYLGTSDNVALELKVDGARALRLEPNAGPISCSLRSTISMTGSVCSGRIVRSRLRISRIWPGEAFFSAERIVFRRPAIPPGPWVFWKSRVM